MTLDELRALAEPWDGGKTHRFPQPYHQMAVTLEEGEFLFALIRMLKPARVLELGSGLGVSAKFIAGALAANRFGDLTTVEPDAELRRQARAMLAGSLRAEVTDEDWRRAGHDIEPPDLVFIDSGYERRAGDIDYWLERHIGERLVVVHDANREYGLERYPGALLPTVDGMWLGRAT